MIDTTALWLVLVTPGSWYDPFAMTTPALAIRWRWRTRARWVALATTVCCKPAPDDHVRLNVISLDGQESWPMSWYSVLLAQDLDADGSDELLVSDGVALGSVLRLDTAEHAPDTDAMTDGGKFVSATWIPVDGDVRQHFLVRSEDSELDPRYPWGETTGALHHFACVLDSDLSCEALGLVPVSELTDSIAVGDFDQDGRLDLLVSANDDLFLHLGNGDATDVSWDSGREYGLAGEDRAHHRQRVVVADFDDDGHVDVAALDRTFGARLYFGDGLGGSEADLALGERDEYDDDEFRGAMTARLGDGHVYLVVQGRHAHLFGFDRDRSLAQDLPRTADSPLDLDGLVVVGDFEPTEGDEIAIIDAVDPEIHVLALGPDATWSARRIDVSALAVSRGSAMAALAADLDGDGLDEVVFTALHNGDSGCGP